MVRTFLALFLLCGSHAAGETPDHSLLNRVLAAHVDSQGGVDYAGLKENPDTLLRYLHQLAETSPDNRPHAFPEEADRLAYWLNAYNAFVLKGVIEAYPISSVKEIAPSFGFFKQVRFKVGGTSVSLDEIEHEIIRKRFSEPRIHATVNCAALSCPPLSRQAFTSGRLEEQLDRQMRSFVNDTTRVRIDIAAGEVVISKIFSWFEGDFTGWYASKFEVPHPRITDYLALYVEASIAEAVRLAKVRHMEYDWSLNSQMKE